MAETFNPIISHLYSGQGGVSREITKYDNTTISEINFKEGGVTTKYDFGGLFIEKMFTGDRVWNQLIQNGNFESDSGWGTNNSSLSVSNNIGTLTASAQNGLMHRATAQVQGHKYLLMATIKLTTGTTDVRFSRGGSVLGGATENTTDWQLVTYFYEGASTGNSYIGIIDRRSSGWDAIQIKNVQLFDLTLIYGDGNEPTTIAEFVHDYPELYYPYDAGTNFSLATKLFNTIKQPLDSIKFYGNTMRWCQLVQNGNFVDTSGWQNINVTIGASDNILTATALSGAPDYYQVYKMVSTVPGHKYLCFATFKTSVNARMYMLFRNTNVSGQVNCVANQWTNIYTLAEATSAYTELNFFSFVGEGLNAGDTYQVKNAQLFDLTYIFGEGNEPTTVSDFTRRLKKLYYPFTNGEILSIEKATEYLYGINIWDEEWEVGGYTSSTGEKDTTTNKIRSKNKIRCFPNCEYYATIGSGLGYFFAFFYDATGAYLGYFSPNAQGSQTFTTPTNAVFMAFADSPEYGTTYNNDICINLSDSSINGTYEASKGEQKMQLDSFNVWDEKWEVGGINDTGANDNTIDSLIRSKNYTRVLQGEVYYASLNGYNARIFFYDGNKTFLSYYDRTGNGTFTVPSNVCYIRFRMNTAYGTTYNNDICINLSDPSRNGIYVPYRRYIELNGVNDAIDTVTVEKNATLPFGLVDMGTLDYHLITATETRDAFYASVDNFRGVSSSSEVPNIIAKNFTPVSYGATWTPWTISVFGDNYSNLAICVPHNMFTEETLKAYLKAFYLYYELADYPLSGTPILAGSYVRKIEKVDLGTLDWTYRDGRFYSSTLPNVKTVDGRRGDWFVISNNYTFTGVHGSGDKTCFIGIAGYPSLYVYDSSYTDAATFKTAMSGVMLYYEIATPVETTLTAQQCAEILNGAFTKSKYSTLLTDNDNGQIDQTVDVGMWEQR